MNPELVRTLLLAGPIFLFSVVAHEYAHGYAALRQGDTTARDLGRLTWNPIKHVDPFMTVIVPLMIFIGSGGRFILGGAKPVPVDPRQFREYRRGDIIVSLAGVASNMVIALACTALLLVVGLIARGLPAAEPTLALVQRMLVFGVWINLILTIFNLIPIPPLDGSHVVKHLLPPRLAAAYQRVGMFGIVLLVGLMWLGAPLRTLLSPALFLGGLLLGSVNDFILPGARP